MPNLVIVESPTKARTINKYLGKDFIVKSSYGHIRDLPVSGNRKKAAPRDKNAKKVPKKEKMFGSMGIDPEHGWKAHYELLPGKTKIVKELKEAAKGADAIYLAADPDREGEAIAWHLKEILGDKVGPYHRVVYQEITKRAIQEAFANPGTINMDRVNAQQARRFLDRIVGFRLSPLLWRQISQGLSAGRVQSVAVRLIVEREREIKAFLPEEYWSLHATLQKGDLQPFEAEVVKYQGQKLNISEEETARKAEAELKNGSYTVRKREDKDTKSRPYPPFVTSTLQQAASVVLGFGVKRTMLLAQRLYESGYITYMRTDSTRLSPDAVAGMREYIQGEFGKPYLPDEPRFYASKAGAQEAHEAIRPSDIRVTASDIKLGRDETRIYDLIWRRALACQMQDASFHTSTVTIQSGDYECVARGRVMLFDGWLKVSPPQGKNGEQADLPDLREGDELALKNFSSLQHFTKPPARFTEASLVKELEKRGIGRPSTYAAIISTIQDRGYARVESKRFFAEKIGEVVTDQLLAGFPDLMNYQFTALMEEELDKIAGAELDWKQVLDHFYKEFDLLLNKAEKERSLSNPRIVINKACPDCGRKMLFHITRSGSFLGCSGYTLTGDAQCKRTLSLMRADEVINLEEYDEELGNEQELLKKQRCLICGMAMDPWLLDEKTRLHLCGNAPKCIGHLLEKGTFQLKSVAQTGEGVNCDRCASPMQMKDGRFGRYFACTNTEGCKNTRKILKSGEIAPPKADPVTLDDLPCERCGAKMLIRDGASGLFLACSAFPKCRQTGSVPIAILATHEAALDPKYTFLARGPVDCPDCGSPVILRFSRKTKTNYYSCEKGLKKKCKWTGETGGGIKKENSEVSSQKSE